MKKILYFLKAYGLTLVLVFGITTQIVNCNGAATDDIADLLPGNGSGGGSGGSTTVETEYGTSDDFYIGLVSGTNPVSHIRTQGSFSTKCKISKDATSSQDLVCIIDVLEGNLYYSGLKLFHHVPKEMCHRLVRGTYWFYNEHSGIGPGYIQLIANKEIDVSSSSGVSTTTFPGTFSCVSGNTSGTASFDAGCDANPELVNVDINTTNGAFDFNCVYDLSEVAGKNCCFGKKTVQVVDRVQYKIDGVASGTTVDVPRNPPFTDNWGGDYKNCIGGPGKTDWTLYGAENFPLFGFNDGIFSSGISETYTVRPAHEVLELTNQSNIHIANSFNSVSHTHGTITPTAFTTNRPYFVEPLDDLSGSSFTTQVIPDTQDELSFSSSGNDSYSYYCQDAGSETIHRIRVYVREWDTYTNYLTYISTSGTTIVPDNNGTAPTADCEGTPGPCNDFDDVDNFVNNLPGGAYSTAVSATSRANNFPRLKYK